MANGSSVRVPEDYYGKVKAIAEHDGDSLSRVLRSALQMYLAYRTGEDGEILSTFEAAERAAAQALQTL